MKETIREQQDEIDKLEQAIQGGDWEDQVRTLVRTTEPEHLAAVIYDADPGDPARAFDLTDQMLQQYAQRDGLVDLEPVELKAHHLCDATMMLKTPAKFVAENSQKARKYADAILNQLDGQTDEPNDLVVAKRIANARGSNSAVALAQRIIEMVGTPDSSADEVRAIVTKIKTQKHLDRALELLTEFREWHSLDTDGDTAELMQETTAFFKEVFPEPPVDPTLDEHGRKKAPSTPGGDLTDKLVIGLRVDGKRLASKDKEAVEWAIARHKRAKGNGDYRTDWPLDPERYTTAAAAEAALAAG